MNPSITGHCTIFHIRVNAPPSPNFAASDSPSVPPKSTSPNAAITNMDSAMVSPTETTNRVFHHGRVSFTRYATFNALLIALTPLDAAHREANSPMTNFHPLAARVTSESVFETNSDADPGMSLAISVIRLFLTCDPGPARNPS